MSHDVSSLLTQNFELKVGVSWLEKPWKENVFAMFDLNQSSFKRALLKTSIFLLLIQAQSLRVIQLTFNMLEHLPFINHR